MKINPIVNLHLRKYFFDPVNINLKALIRLGYEDAIFFLVECRFALPKERNNFPCLDEDIFA